MIQKGNIYIISEKISLVFYNEIKHKWVRKGYIEFCSRNERRWFVGIEAEVWKLRWLEGDRKHK